MPSKEAIRIETAYRRVFDSPEGRVVLEDMRQAWDVQSYVRGDVHATAFNAGLREAYLQIQSQLAKEK